MVPSETLYLFLLVIGFLSLAATVAVLFSASVSGMDEAASSPAPLTADTSPNANAKQEWGLSTM